MNVLHNLKEHMMNVKLIERIEDDYGFEETTSFTIETPKGRFGLCNLNECPEDATLNRDLSGIYSVPAMFKEAYEAGQAGEELTFEDIVEED